jgi:hypothetical protein
LGDLFVKRVSAAGASVDCRSERVETAAVAGVQFPHPERVLISRKRTDFIISRRIFAFFDALRIKATAIKSALSRHMDAPLATTEG